MPAKTFHLAKWYLDCVGEDGEVFIGYAGLAHYKRFQLSYASALRCGDGMETANDSSLRPFRAPTQNGSDVSWTPDGLSLEGKWQATADPLSATVYRDGDAAVEWRCWQPRANAHVRFRE